MFEFPRFSPEYDGGIAADDDASAGVVSAAGGTDASESVPRNELTSAFVRIFSGTSSRMAENVSRWSIRLQSLRSAGFPPDTTPKAITSWH